VNTSRDVKIAGAIGPCASMDAKGAHVADVSVGIGGTTAWKMCGLNNSTTLATFYKIVPATQGAAAGGQMGNQATQQFFLQFLTQ
jgi:protein transport protein SEC23